MNTLLLYFLLAHFLADYLLQPGKLVRLKIRRYLGVFIHVLVHLGVMILVMAPFLHERRVWIAIGIIYVTHNIIDQTKVQLDKRNPGKTRFFYFLDQFLHWSVIAGVAFYVGRVSPHLTGQWLTLYSDTDIIIYLFCLVLATYFYDVTRYFVTLKVGSSPYQRDYKAIVRNALIVTAGFVIFWVLSFMRMG